MFGLNNAQLIGRLGADATISHLTNGGRVANVSIATDESYLDKNSGDIRTPASRMSIMHRHLVDLHVGDEVLCRGNRLVTDIFTIGFDDLRHVSLTLVRVVARVRVGRMPTVSHGTSFRSRIAARFASRSPHSSSTISN